MKTHIKRLLLSALSMMLYSGNIWAQQYAQYSQYMFNRQYINPAYAGSKGGLNLNSYYRSQWASIDGGPRTIGVAADMPLNDENVGVGINIINDKIGLENRLYTYANYAYRLRMGEDFEDRLSLGVSLGFLHTSYDNAQIKTGDAEAVFVEKATFPDARLGVYYTVKRFYVGASVDNILARMLYDSKERPNILPPVMQFYLNSGGLIDISEGIMLKPSLLLKSASQGDSRALTMDISTSVVFNDRFAVGGSYRGALSKGTFNSPTLKKANALIALLEIGATDALKIAYSYDYMLGGIQKSVGSSHEISLSYTFSRSNHLQRTPRFF